MSDEKVTVSRDRLEEAMAELLIRASNLLEDSLRFRKRGDLGAAGVLAQRSTAVLKLLGELRDEAGIIVIGDRA